MIFLIKCEQNVKIWLCSFFVFNCFFDQNSLSSYRHKKSQKKFAKKLVLEDDRILVEH